MPLSPPPPRKPHHIRRVTYESYDREDGLIDIEARIRDEKGFVYEELDRGFLEIGQPIHDMFARVTIDEDTIIHAIEVDMQTAPFSFCDGGGMNAQRLVGASIKGGWRKALNEAMGGTQGCTHLRELLFGVGTVAFQTVSRRQMKKAEETALADPGNAQMPFFLNACHSWALDSPVVERLFPQFYNGPGTKDT